MSKTVCSVCVCVDGVHSSARAGSNEKTERKKNERRPGELEQSERGGAAAAGQEQHDGLSAVQAGGREKYSGVCVCVCEAAGV